MPLMTPFQPCRLIFYTLFQVLPSLTLESGWLRSDLINLVLMFLPPLFFPFPSLPPPLPPPLPILPLHDGHRSIISQTIFHSNPCLNLYQTFIQPSSNLYQTFITPSSSSSNLHQICIQPSSTLHQTFIKPLLHLHQTPQNL